MSTVVFTGKGLDPLTGKLRTRDEWTALANAKGWDVQDKVTVRTDYLVASRSDTKKAEAARYQGTKVISYKTFEQMIRGAIPVEPSLSGRAPPPKPIDPTEMEHIEGWGKF
jgi:BRCT domain type II-containing protein